MADTVTNHAKVAEVHHWVQDYRYNDLDHNNIENDAQGNQYSTQSKTRGRFN